MRTTLIYFLFATTSVLAQRQFGGDRGGGGRGGDFFNRPSGNTPNTFVTIASAAPAATPGTGSPANPPASSSPPDDPPATDPPAAGNGGSSGGSTGSVDASLIPPFGITAGIKANDGTANCVGDGGKGIPCDCPPSLNTFVSAVEDSVAAGAAFPTGSSASAQLARLGTCIITLQNFKGGAGSGVGCPAVSTTWKELQAELQGQV